MIQLALIVAAVVLAVLIPCYVTARYLAWRAWDADRRIMRLEERRRS